MSRFSMVVLTGLFVLAQFGCSGRFSSVSNVLKPSAVRTSKTGAGTWVQCATENQRCAFQGVATVRYGAGTTFVELDRTDGTLCSNSVFGDPLPGTIKRCEIWRVDLSTTATNWTVCAKENENCPFSGTRRVRYGANGTYSIASFSNGTACTNSVFGDPLPGVYKSCELESTNTVSPTAPQTGLPTSGSIVSVQLVSNSGCLGRSATSGSTSDQLFLLSCDSTDRQRYKYQVNADQTVTLINVQSSLCVDIPYASASPGTTLREFACNGTAAQSFKVVSASPSYKIVSLSNSLCLDGSRSDRALQQLGCGGSQQQSFNINVGGSAPAPNPAPVPAPAPPVPTTPAPNPAPAPTAGAPKIGVGYRKGVAVGLYYLDATQLAAAIADMKSMGVTWVRMEFPWNIIQAGGPNTYNLEAWDRAVIACQQAGIQMLGLIDYTPQWARPAGTSQFHPPSDPNAFGTYSGFLARRYAPMGVHVWEIWNEENGATFFHPGPNATVYVSLLKASYNAIKAVDSQSTVMLGGMATFGDDGVNQNARTFLANVYAAGGKPYFDAIAFHPYTYPELPGTSIYNNWGQMSASSPSLRSIMSDNGDGFKKIWLTEFGYPTYPNGAPRMTESGQAAYLKQAYEMHATYDWAGPLFWYTYQDARVQDPNNPEDYFGLLRGDGSFKPSYLIYKNLPK